MDIRLNDVSDWYAVLQVSPQADQADIKSAWRRACLTLHPDKRDGGQPASTDGFHLACRAFSVLRDPAVRRVYDAALALSRRQQDHPVQEELTVSELLDNSTDRDDAEPDPDEAEERLDNFSFYWDCRCGDRVRIHAAQLISRVPLVQCHTCSLCLRIVYDEAEPRTRDLLARLAEEAESLNRPDFN